MVLSATGFLLPGSSPRHHGSCAGGDEMSFHGVVSRLASVFPDRLFTTQRPGSTGESGEDESALRGRGGGKERPDSRAGADYHVSVLMDEVLEALAPGPGKVILDATLGGGGHSEKLLEAGAEVIGLDQDPEALAFAGERLARFGNRFRTVRSNFAGMAQALSTIGREKVDGILMDLGVSSRQLENPERGFSFQSEGPLDMRMDPSAPMSAADLLAEADEAELTRILREYGEENAARKIARAIVRDREKEPFITTAQLAAFLERIVPRRSGKHPGTRTFQALRMAVNDELGVLERALEQSVSVLAEGGRLAVITFHSLEDRLVKQFLRRHSEEWLDRPEWPAPRPNPEYHFRLLMKKGVTAAPYELESNPRSRSARLRAAERIHDDPAA